MEMPRNWYNSRPYFPLLITSRNLRLNKLLRCSLQNSKQLLASRTSKISKHTTKQDDPPRQQAADPEEISLVWRKCWLRVTQGWQRTLHWLILLGLI